MVKQRIESYSDNSLYNITEEIANDAERYKMPIKTVSMSAVVCGYSLVYRAIAVFEEVKENE